MARNAFVTAACLAFGLVLFAATPGDGDGNDDPIDPDSTPLVQVPQAPAIMPFEPRVREVMQRAIRMPIEDRPAYFASVLADPALTTSERERLEKGVKLFLLTQPRSID